MSLIIPVPKNGAMRCPVFVFGCVCVGGGEGRGEGGQVVLHHHHHHHHCKEQTMRVIITPRKNGDMQWRVCVKEGGGSGRRGGGEEDLSISQFLGG